MEKPAILLISVFIIIIIIGLIFFIKEKLEEQKDKTKKQIQQTQKQATYPKYRIKQKYMSNCELDFYYGIKSIIKDKYVIFPQVPLSQIVEKTTDDKYINELFRTIDFCIFNFQMNPLVCIEINDSSHYRNDRYIRDKKVQAILAEAELPLITLWTEYGVNCQYIEQRLKAHLEI